MPFLKASEPEEVRVDRTTLLRFSGARADPYTRFVASLIFHDIKLSVKGQRNINHAFTNLPVYDSIAPDRRLAFGWGEDNVIRDKVIQEGLSYDHLAILTALGENFHEVYGAKVLQALTSSIAGPKDMKPHFSQWRAAMHACNGLLATTDFGILVEEYVRLDPYRVMLVNDIESIFPPATIAEALQALIRVSANHEKQVTFIGSAVISWFGSVAEWLCDLRVAVYDSAGALLHSTHRGLEAQVVLVFVEAPGIKFSFEPWKEDAVDIAKLSITAQVYPSNVHTTPFSGRVAWQSLLPRVFGTSFHYLDHEESKAFGGMIGGAAKMFQGLALGEGHEKHTELVSTQNRSNTASYGSGLVETLTNWLPELRRFQGRMERALKLNHEDASRAYVEYLIKIRKACHCGICTSKEEVDSEKEGLPPSHGYCLAVIVETIISLGLVLSRMTVSPGIFPSRAGIQSFYAGQVQKRMEARGLHWTEHFKLVYGNEWNAPAARRLQNAAQIFAGSRPEKDLPDNLVALSHEGICAYFVALEKRSKIDLKNQVKLIRIVSGGIAVREKVFDRACMGEVTDAAFDDPWEEVALEHLEASLYCK
ncbi:hypothetical protein LTR84_002568 [Exophiala bonariae]|uniref:Uncharacterized protein n=1 Tax=Exophiala bonariae TaxID=1690606 RepID=A0AAV9NDH2_9EURO|nr:hypothetical protein LTR84_002568 [Exophiala bonariae]